MEYVKLKDKVFTVESLERCKKAHEGKIRCGHNGCRRVPMGNGKCYNHGGENSEQDIIAKLMERKRKNNECNRKRQAQKRKNPREFEIDMRNRELLRKGSNESAIINR